MQHSLGLELLCHGSTGSVSATGDACNVETKTEPITECTADLTLHVSAGICDPAKEKKGDLTRGRGGDVSSLTKRNKLVFPLVALPALR